MSSEAPAGWPPDYPRRDETGWISFGAFLILVAAIYLTTPNIVQEVENFILDFRLVQVFDNFSWPIPANSHPVLYAAAQRFCYAFGLVQLGILGLRFARKSSVHGKAETFSGVVFWLGAGYVLGMLSEAALSWLSFIGALIIVVGITIVARALVLMLAPRRPR